MNKSLIIICLFFCTTVFSQKINLSSASRYSDTEQIWISFYDMNWNKNGHPVYKDGEFQFNLLVDEGFQLMRSFEGKYNFNSTQSGLGKKLKECIISNGWFDSSKECDCSTIKF
tara:strand:- start:143 stop:484 length:342 start_codon:yes stop_codon:yes gene_type:complete